MGEIEKYDPRLKEHSTRVANQCVLFSKELGLPANDINHIYLSALLHDIGMIFIPKKIAAKKHGLIESEMAFIKKHTLISERILSKHEMLKPLLPIIRYHHEALDGSGYPDGLTGKDIPIGSNIISIINSYDNYTTSSINGILMNQDEALIEIKKLAGQIFEKSLVQKFIHFIEHIKKTDQENIDQNKPEPETVIKKEAGTETKEANLNTGTINEIIAEIINDFKKNDINLPILPAILKEIQDVMNSPSSGVDQLAAVIEKDAVISVRLISVSNSALYRGTEKILTVKQAIPRIGAKETQSIVATIANKGLYEVKDKIFKILMEKLWKHSLASAFAARALSDELKLGDSEKYYFMGLVHDIGKVLILKTLGDVHYENKSFSVNKMMLEAKATHTSFGSAILRKWGFTDDYCRICLRHSGSKFKNTTDKDILIINLAGNIAKKAGYGVTSETDQINIATLDSRILLNIEPPRIDSIIETVNKQMNDTSNIFS